MLELGANVNHTDLHNTTPLMDLVSLGDEERALRELTRMERSGRYHIYVTHSSEHRVHRVATVAFWRTFHHEGKISPGW